MSFDWQTEEETGWDDPGFVSSDSDDKKPEGKPRRWRWLMPVGLLVVALVVAGWTLNRRVQTVTSQVDADILASYQLVEQAIIQQDGEVFQNLLSGRNANWADTMTQAVEQGNLMDRSGLALNRLPVSETSPHTIEVSSDLRIAEVTTLVPYAIEVGNGLTETVELVQTAVYRRGANRWLLSPPDSEIWGGVSQIEGQYVKIFYPERDKDIVQSLLFRLEDKIGEICTQTQDIDCPDDYHLIVKLTIDPREFSHLNLISVIEDANRRHFILPTPSLVGLPLDQTAENALFRGYVRLVAAAVLTDLWDYRCCEDGNALFMAVLENHLRQLGLQAWAGEVGTAVSPEMVDTMLADGLPQLFDDFSLWEESVPESTLQPEERAAVVVAFAQQELNLADSDLVQNLINLRRYQSIGDWLRAVSRTSLSARELENAWLSFVYNNSSVAQQSVPAPLPEQDIELLCHMGGEERMAFYRYNLAEGDTQLEQPLNREVNVMVALPDDNGLAVWEAGFDDDLTSMFLWVDDMKTAVSWDAADNAPGPVPMRVAPTGNHLLLAPAMNGQVNYGLLDVAGCLDNACQLDTLEGYPTWSPDLAHMILLNTEDFRAHMAQARGELILTDSLGEELETIGAGTSPFWLDNDTYGFVMDAGEGRRNTVLSGKVGDVGTSDVLLTVADLIEDKEDPYLRLIDFIAVHPTIPNHLIIVTMDLESDEDTFDWWKRAQPGATLFVYDLEAKETVLMQPFAEDVALNRSYRFSPNGRFLFFGEGAEYRPTRLYLLDITSGESKVLLLQAKFIDSIEWYTDFSLDGEWLLVVDNGFLHLLYPGSEYHQLIIPTTDQCETAVFVNKESAISQ